MENIEEKSESENQIEQEIEALRQIMMAVNNLDDQAKKRAFQYLKDKYKEQWPQG